MPSRRRSFFEPDRPMLLRQCDSPGCNQPGDYRAPKSPDKLNEYYWFCLEHVQEYNANWDFLEGCSAEDIEKKIRAAALGERPTWPMGEWSKKEQALNEKIAAMFGEENETGYKPKEAPLRKTLRLGEKEALAVLGLEIPTELFDIKTRYRDLVKKHHPDANGGSKESEEIFKGINQAFTLLQKIYEEDEEELI